MSDKKKLKEDKRGAALRENLKKRKVRKKETSLKDKKRIEGES